MAMSKQQAPNIDDIEKEQPYDVVIRIKFPDLTSAILAKNNIKEDGSIGNGLVLMKIERSLDQRLYLGFTEVQLRG